MIYEVHYTVPAPDQAWRDETTYLKSNKRLTREEAQAAVRRSVARAVVYSVKSTREAKP